MQKSQRSAQKRIIFLDYLRIFAFLSVLIGHKFFSELVSLSEKPWLHETPRQLLKLLTPLFYGGGSGVVVFFLVSGYIISWSIQTETTTAFFVKRLFRIYPLFIAAVSIETLLNHGTFSISRFSLLGDFWGIPYSLGNVEWTLRVELLFYLFMGILGAFGFFQQNIKHLFPALFFSLILLQVLSPFPKNSNLFQSYATTYGSFLLIGVMFFLLELKIVQLKSVLAITVVSLLQYFYNIAKYHPAYLSSHFALYGLVLFVIAWTFRSSFAFSPLVTFVSELTYSVYLFHNWLFDFFYTFLAEKGMKFVYAKLLAVVPLFVFCFIISRAIEKPALNFGKYLLHYFYGGGHKKQISDLN